MTNDFAPIFPWPCQFVCDVSTESAAATGMAAKAASEVLWALSGRRFGFTRVTLRPCCNWQRDTPYPDGWLSWPGTQPPPLGATTSGGGYGPGYWFGAGCGSCADSCSCIGGCTEVKLPAPVHEIIEVKIDGVVFSDLLYRLDDNRFLVRLDGGIWPSTNDLTLDDSEVGTWSVTADYGEDLPEATPMAVGEIACEFIKALRGEDCRLPKAVTSLARQGVTISMPDPSGVFDKGSTGLYLTDLFIATWNPKHLRARSKTYSVDTRSFRRAGS